MKSAHEAFLIEVHITVDSGVDAANSVVRLDACDLGTRVSERVLAGLETSIRNLDSLVERHLQRAAADDQAAAAADARLRPFPDQGQLDNIRSRHVRLLAELNGATPGVDDGVIKASQEPAAHGTNSSADPVSAEPHGVSSSTRAAGRGRRAVVSDTASGLAHGL